MKTKLKAYVTHAKTGRRIFCIAFAHPFSGLVQIQFFVPTSIYISSPDLEDNKYFYGVPKHKDERQKTMLVYYIVHPSYMLGTSFPVENPKSVFQVAEELINQFELKP